MNWDKVTFDWNHIRAFLATVDEGSLSAAARVLHQTQPTLSRQVSALEDDLGVTLFQRGTRAMILTDAGLGLMEHVRSMGEAAQRISLSASGQAQSIGGRVTITATDVVATYHLPPILRQIADVAPDLIIEVVASDEVRDLTRREADIAIRHARPEQADLIAKKIGETEAHFYAAEAYIRRYGEPKSQEALAAARFVGIIDVDRMVNYLNAMGISVSADNFRANTKNGTAMLGLVEQGLGIGIITRESAALLKDIRRVMTDAPAFPVPTWLVTHRELNTSRRIRLVFDMLAESLDGRF